MSHNSHNGGTLKSKNPHDLPDEDKTSRPTKATGKRTLDPAPVKKVGGSRPFHVYLSELNAKAEDGDLLTGPEQQQLWHDFLWASQPDAALLEECGGMNGMHMRGLLIARALAFGVVRSNADAADARKKKKDSPMAVDDGGPEAMDEDEDADDDDGGPSIVDLIPACDDVHIYDTPVDAYTARELRDVVEGVQLNLHKVLAKQDAGSCRNALLHLFTRFGTLANSAFGGEVMDDLSSITHIPGDDPKETLFIFTCKALRTFINIFVVLFRAIEIHAKAVPIDVCDIDNGVSIMQGTDTKAVGKRYVQMVCDMIKPYHVESSLDEYNIIQQLYFLCAGQRLAYRHNFAGMFHDVSQVTYYHYPDYVRDPQVPVDALPDKALNALPCVCNIIPQLRILYDDDDKLPFGSGGGNEWTWIVSVKRIYLWDGKRQRLLKSRGTGIMDLTAFYLLSVHGMDFFGKKQEDCEEDDAEERVQRVKMTDFGHARIVRRKHK